MWTTFAHSVTHRLCCVHTALSAPLAPISETLITLSCGPNAFGSQCEPQPQQVEDFPALLVPTVSPHKASFIQCHKNCVAHALLVCAACSFWPHECWLAARPPASAAWRKSRTASQLRFRWPPGVLFFLFLWRPRQGLMPSQRLLWAFHRYDGLLVLSSVAPGPQTVHPPQVQSFQLTPKPHPQVKGGRCAAHRTAG